MSLRSRPAPRHDRYQRADLIEIFGGFTGRQHDLLNNFDVMRSKRALQGRGVMRLDILVGDDEGAFAFQEWGNQFTGPCQQTGADQNVIAALAEWNAQRDRLRAGGDWRVRHRVYLPLPAQ